MADREKLKAEVNPLTNTLVQNILRKHGVSKDNVRTLSEEEKENILKILEDLKAQSEALIQRQQEKKKKRTMKHHHNPKNAQDEEENVQVKIN